MANLAVTILNNLHTELQMAMACDNEKRITYLQSEIAKLEAQIRVADEAELNWRQNEKRN